MLGGKPGFVGVTHVSEKVIDHVNRRAPCGE
jgi:hypothetical protein